MKFHRLILGLGFALAPTVVLAGPMWGRMFLAAGIGDPAYRDGNFDTAALKAPDALAVSKDGKTIYIADTGNDAIRKVLLDQNSIMQTLAGSPGSQSLLSPTAICLSYDQSSLYLVAGKQSSLLRMSVTGGETTALGAVSVTALAQHPNTGILYVLDGGRGVLSAWDESSGKSVSFTALDGLKGAEGTLSVTDQDVYFLENTTGALYRFEQGARRLATISLADIHSNNSLQWERIATWGPGATGLAASMDLTGGQWFLWVWDENAALFHKINADTGVSSDYPLKDYSGKWILKDPPFDVDPFAIDGSSFAADRPAFKGPVAIQCDQPRNLLYIAEPDGNRILGLQHPRWDMRRDDNLPNYETGTKAPGVTRILLLGDSMVFSGEPGAGDNANIATGFGTKLELYLNLLASAKGKGRRFEVLQQSVAFGAMGGGITSYFANLPAELQSLGIDEVITLLTYMNVNGELLAMTHTKSPDDIPMALVDPFFFNQTPDEMVKNYGPLHRGFLAWLPKASPAVQYWVQQAPGGKSLNTPHGSIFSEPISDPEYRSWVVKVHAKVLDAALKKAKDLHIKLVEVLLPLRNQMAPAENMGGGLCYSETTDGAWMDDDLARVAASKSVEFINLTPVLRTMEPTIFPVVAAGIHHLKTRSVDWAALATASEYVDKLP